MMNPRPCTRVIDDMRKWPTWQLVITLLSFRTMRWLIVLLFAVVMPDLRALVPMLTWSNLSHFTAQNDVLLGDIVFSLANFGLLWWLVDFIATPCDKIIRERHIQ